jgi:hypothetical protein
MNMDESYLTTEWQAEYSDLEGRKKLQAGEVLHNETFIFLLFNKYYYGNQG